jgi:hypothetical protein
VRSWGKDTVALHQQFFDYWLKGVDNGIMDQPPVRLEVRQPGGGWKTRFEYEWPLARTSTSAITSTPSILKGMA